MKQNAKIANVAIALMAMFFSKVSYAEEIIYNAPEENTVTNPVANNPYLNKQDIPIPAQVSQQAAPPQITVDQARQRFVELKKEIDAGSKNLDTYFEYAQMATALGESKIAVMAYQHMLQVDSGLQRVKLELALLYVRMGKLKESKQLFEEVLATNPPEAVKKNIQQVMVFINNGLKQDVFSGSVFTGYNLDSNANSAASTGQTTFADTSIPLSASSLAQRDGHFYVSTSLTHDHKFDINSDHYKLSLETTGTLYKTYQDTEHTLDIGLASFKTGPILELPDIKTKLGINGTESIIDLDGNRYLKTRSWESDVTYSLRDNLLLNGAYIYEYRKFINTPIATTYTDRSGNANQQNIGITYALTPLDIFNTTLSWRYENAESQVYGNTQESITGSYTRQLPWGLSFNTLLGFKKTNYHEPDPLVSSADIRHDRERSMTYTLAKILPYNVNISTAYQYKNTTSNVQNYDYANNRYSVALGWSF